MAPMTVLSPPHHAGLYTNKWVVASWPIDFSIRSIKYQLKFICHFISFGASIQFN